MNRYALYDPATGVIQSMLRANSENADLNAWALGFMALPVADDFAGDDTTHMVVDGELVIA